MKKLYHYPLDAFGRIVRIYLSEKGEEFEAIEEFPWERKEIFSEKHFLSDLPTLVERDRTVIESAPAIISYCEQTSRSKISLQGNSFSSKAEIQRLCSLFNISFFAEVTNHIVFEKIMKKHLEKTYPDSSMIRAGIRSLPKYLEYIAWLTDRRNWLAGEEFSLADISAAAHISCLDYLASIEWENYPEAKNWYVRVKSRPSFREILKDRVGDAAPPAYYSELDF